MSRSSLVPGSDTTDLCISYPLSWISSSTVSPLMFCLLGMGSFNIWSLLSVSL